MRTPCWISILTLVTLASISPQLAPAKVKAYPNPNADFARYKTYQWFPPRVLTKTGIDENHPEAPNLKAIIGRHLAQRGLNEVAEGGDLQIQAWVVSETSPQLEAVIISSVTVAPGSYMSIGDPIATIGRYNREGTLYLNLIDSQTKKSAWSAMATDSLPTRPLKPEEIRAKLEKAVAAIFKKYPAKK